MDSSHHVPIRRANSVSPRGGVSYPTGNQLAKKLFLSTGLGVCIDILKHRYLDEIICLHFRQGYVYQGMHVYPCKILFFLFDHCVSDPKRFRFRPYRENLRTNNAFWHHLARGFIPQKHIQQPSARGSYQNFEFPSRCK